MNILIIGCGAREHAIALALQRSPSFKKRQAALFAAGGYQNPGLAALCSGGKIQELDITNPTAVTEYAKEARISLAIIGPEAPLETGVSDYLWHSGIPVVGPRRELAKLETSKTFTRELLSEIASETVPQYQHVSSSPEAEAEADAFISSLIDHGHGFVIKAEGLRGGKGVKVSGDHLHTKQEALDYCKELLEGDGECLIEEKLEGEEFSLLTFTDGKSSIHMPAVQDHKRAGEGDTGPNTGGMGSYTDADHSLPFLDPSDIKKAETINQKITAALYKKTGLRYQGILYGGFMACRDGIKVIEYNARFGDPEVLNLLPLLSSDFLSICSAIAGSSLSEIKKKGTAFLKKATVCKYAVPRGYPESPVKGSFVDVSALKNGESIQVFLGSVEAVRSGTETASTKTENLILMGSRAAAVTALGDTIAEAEKLAEDVVASIRGDVFHRRDIGTEALIQQRIVHMQQLRRSSASKDGVQE